MRVMTWRALSMSAVPAWKCTSSASAAAAFTSTESLPSLARRSAAAVARASCCAPSLFHALSSAMAK